MPRLRYDQWIAFLLLCCMLALSPGHVSSQLSVSSDPVSVSLLKAAPIPVVETVVEATNSAKKTNDLEVSAQAALVLDIPSASTLYQKNIHEPLYPASTTKMLTALVARELYSETATFAAQRSTASNGTTLGLASGTVLTFEDVVRAMLLFSANDLADLFASNHPQGTPGFIQEMQEKAARLQLSDSTFANPSGLDDPNQLSTAWDLSILARELLQDPLLAPIVATPSALLTDQATGRQFWVYNTNALVHGKEGYTGVKTGTTERAGEVLVSRYQNDGRDLLIIVMKSSNRYQDTRQLVDWVLTHTTWIEPDLVH